MTFSLICSNLAEKAAVSKRQLAGRVRLSFFAPLAVAADSIRASPARLAIPRTFHFPFPSLCPPPPYTDTEHSFYVPDGRPCRLNCNHVFCPRPRSRPTPVFPGAAAISRPPTLRRRSVCRYFARFPRSIANRHTMKEPPRSKYHQTTLPTHITVSADDTSRPPKNGR